MFWRFGYHNPSAVDTLLDREDVTLEQVLEEEELLQEAKSHNQRLINFLCQPTNCRKLLYYITADDLEEGQKYKYPFLSSEIIACEIPQLVDMIVLEQKELLETFWQYLDRPIRQQDTHQLINKHDDEKDKQNDNDKDNEDEEKVDHGLDSLLASYFAKTITIFLTKQPAEMLEFIQSEPENLNKILNHLHSSAIMDLLLTLVRMEEFPEGKGTVQWLSDGGLMDNLISRLDPYMDTEEHSIAQQCICEIIRMSQTSLLEQPSIGLNDLVIKLKSETVMRKLAGFMLDPNAPNATSTLINSVTIIIDLIRHNNSDMESDPMVNTGYGYTGNIPPVRPVSVSLADMLKVLADHVGSFNQLLIEPRSVGPMKTSIGEQMPLGFERLKICELFAELLHCSNMSNLNAMEDGEETECGQQFNQQGEQDIGDNTIIKEEQDKSLDQQSHESDVKLPTTAVSPPTLKDTDSTSQNNVDKSIADTSQETMQYNTGTTGSIQQDQQDLPMGDYLKLQLVQHKVLPTCVNLFFSFPWNNFLHYVTYDMLHQDGQLTTRMVKAQKENDEQWVKPKGMRLGYMGHLTFIADEVIKLFEGYPESVVKEIKDDVDLDLWYQYCENELRETKERDCLPLGGDRPNEDDNAMREEEDDEEDELDGGTASQYSRYLAQREADGGLEDDDDDAHWITGRNDNIYNNGFHVIADGHNQVSGIDDDADYDSDEEEHDNQAITQDWSRGFTEFPQANMLRRTQSHVEDGYDDEEYDHFSDERHTNDNDDDNDDDAFGEFTSADDAWGISAPLEQLDITPNDTKTTISEDHYVRAIRTKEEDEKYRNEYHLDEEQEGEI
ncbi:SIT4 phosphatase-associated protein-domain-containing protein [Chlamydoabsidia padenii]|nr:SIT4 phosphatase-associated protein-domain-containing protein [Chlamydoabsidia padenii]